MSGFRLYLITFMDSVRPPVGWGGFRREIAPSERILTLVDDHPGWESDFAMGFGTIPSRMVAVPLTHPIEGGSVSIPLDDLAPLGGWVSAVQLKSIRIRLRALELRAEFIESQAGTVGGEW